jgi:alkylhydroperoxidase family enzyme
MAQNPHGARVSLETRLLDLARLRVAQIHRCKWTARELVRSLKTQGEKPRRLRLLKDWRTQKIFSDREKAALNLAEAVTLNVMTKVPENAFRVATLIFGESETLCLILAILAENDWLYLKASSTEHCEGNFD